MFVRLHQAMAEGFRQFPDLFVLIRYEVKGFAFGNKCLVGFSYDLVKEAKRAAADLTDLGADLQYVLVMSRRFIAAVRFGDDHQSTFFLFHFLVRETSRPA